MKSFIKDKLRLVLEGRLATHTSSNNPIGNNKSIGFIGDEDLFKHEMSIMANIYRKNKEAFYPREGEGLYEFQMVSLGEGKFKIFGKQNSVGKKRQGGMDSDGNNSRYFYVTANNDTQPKDLIQYKMGKYPDETGRKEYSVSPADMAFVKLLTEMVDRVLDFMDSESGYDDGKGHDIGAEKMKDYEARKKDKKDLEMELGQKMNNMEWERYKESGQLPIKRDNSVSISSDKAALTAEKQRLLGLWKSEKDRNVKKDLKKQIDQIKRLEKQR